MDEVNTDRKLKLTLFVELSFCLHFIIMFKIPVAHIFSLSIFARSGNGMVDISFTRPEQSISGSSKATFPGLQSHKLENMLAFEGSFQSILLNGTMKGYEGWKGARVILFLLIPGVPPKEECSIFVTLIFENILISSDKTLSSENNDSKII